MIRFVVKLPAINKAMQEGNTQQSGYGRARDLKAYAKAVSFLQGREITTLAQFQDTVSGIKKRYRDTNKRIKQTEKQIHERKELVDQSEKYLKYRPVYKEYKQTKPRKKERFYDEHTAELILYQTAERYLKEHLGTNNILDLKGWKAEIKTLASEKRCLYSEVQSLQDEVQEAETIRKCVEQTVQTEQTKTKIKRKNMEL